MHVIACPFQCLACNARISLITAPAIPVEASSDDDDSDVAGGGLVNYSESDDSDVEETVMQPRVQAPTLPTLDFGPMHFDRWAVCECVRVCACVNVCVSLSFVVVFSSHPFRYAACM